MTIEERLTDYLNTEAAAVPAVPDLLEQVKLRRSRRTHRLHVIGAAVAVLAVTAAVSVVALESQPSGQGQTVGSPSASPDLSPTPVAAIPADITGVWLPVYVRGVASSRLAGADKQRLTIGPTWISTSDDRCGNESSAWTYTISSDGVVRLKEQGVPAIGCALAGGVILNSGVMRGAATMRVIDGILTITDVKDGKLRGRYRRVSGTPDDSLSPSPMPSVLTIKDGRLAEPFDYPGSDVMLSPVAASYEPAVSAAEAVSAFEHSDFAKGESEHEPQQFLAEMERVDGRGLTAVWIFRFSGEYVMPNGGPPQIRPSAGVVASYSPPKPQLSDELVMISASTGEGLGMYIDGSVPSASS
jgi:hypothetical protein